MIIAQKTIIEIVSFELFLRGSAHVVYYNKISNKKAQNKLILFFLNILSFNHKYFRLLAYLKLKFQFAKRILSL